MNEDINAIAIFSTPNLSRLAWSPVSGADRYRVRAVLSKVVNYGRTSARILNNYETAAPIVDLQALLNASLLNMRDPIGNPVNSNSTFPSGVARRHSDFARWELTYAVESRDPVSQTWALAGLPGQVSYHYTYVEVHLMYSFSDLANSIMSMRSALPDVAKTIIVANHPFLEIPAAKGILNRIGAIKRLKIGYNLADCTGGVDFPATELDSESPKFRISMVELATAFPGLRSGMQVAHCNVLDDNSVSPSRVDILDLPTLRLSLKQKPGSEVAVIKILIADSTGRIQSRNSQRFNSAQRTQDLNFDETILPATVRINLRNFATHLSPEAQRVLLARESCNEFGGLIRTIGTESYCERIINPVSSTLFTVNFR